MKFLSHLLQVFFPRVCLSCREILSEHDREVCHKCLSKIPYTTYKLDKKNEIYQQIIPFVEIEAATALVFFSKQGIIQELMHQLKYKGHQEVGDLFGNILGNKIIEQQPDIGIDAVIPIPLHSSKLKKRGYNQLTKFGQSLSRILNANYEDQILYKAYPNETQTRKTALQRKENVKGIFDLRFPEKYQNKHLLLIDDVITTGATLVEAARTLKQIEGVKISIATIASADQL